MAPRFGTQVGLLREQRQALMAECVRRHGEGESLEALAARFGRTEKTIRRWLEEQGIDPAPQRVDPLAEDRKRLAAECARRYAAGATLKGLAAEYGCSPTTIGRLVVEHGGTVRPIGRPRGTRTSRPVPSVASPARQQAIVTQVREGLRELMEDR